MEKNNRYDVGISTVKNMVSQEALDTIGNMKDISPDFWEMIVAFGFGDVYSRDGLTLDKREIITITALITQGAFSQLDFHIRAALNVGLTQKEIKEIIIQCAAYVGFPKACQAMIIAGDIFKEME